MALLLGVDGGNTKTVALVARPDGTVLGAGRAGCSDLYNAASEAAAVAEVVRAVRGALDAADASAADVHAAAFGLAGADWPEDFLLFQAELGRELGLRCEPQVANDALTPVYAGVEDGRGAAVSLGTYLALGARGPAGEWWGSWWLPDLGAVALGRAALHAVCRAHLGLEPATALAPALCGLFDAAGAEELLHGFTRRGGRDERQLGRAAPAVLDAAARGDAAAAGIVERLAADAAEYVELARRRAGLEDGYPLVLAGAVFRHAAGLVEAALARHLPTAQVRRPALEPAAGALLMAAAQAEAAMSRQRLAATMPPPAFFATEAAPAATLAARA